MDVIYLAHELGHIMLGHLDATQEEMSKEQEDDADNFAHSLLCGPADLPTVQPDIPTAELKRIVEVLSPWQTDFLDTLLA